MCISTACHEFETVSNVYAALSFVFVFSLLYMFNFNSHSSVEPSSSFEDEEGVRRTEFLQGLVISTMFDDFF